MIIIKNLLLPVHVIRVSLLENHALGFFSFSFMHIETHGCNIYRSRYKVTRDYSGLNDVIHRG